MIREVSVSDLTEVREIEAKSQYSRVDGATRILVSQDSDKQLFYLVDGIHLYGL